MVVAVRRIVDKLTTGGAVRVIVRVERLVTISDTVCVVTLGAMEGLKVTVTTNVEVL